MEHYVLKVLNFDMGAANILHFVERFLNTITVPGAAAILVRHLSMVR